MGSIAANITKREFARSDFEPLKGCGEGVPRC